MRDKRNYRHIFVLLFVLIFLVLGGWSALLLSHVLQKSSTVVQRATATIGRASPTPTIGATPTEETRWKGSRLVIPAIGVDAPLEAVGVMPDGSMGVPTQQQWDGVGWYKYGAYPGDDGSAVIDGHLDRPGGSPAVFWNLHNLQPGDIVKVIGGDGAEDQFRVTRLSYYAPNNAPLKDIFENDSGTFLNLITCAGQWIPEQHQTTLRLVVYTEMI